MRKHLGPSNDLFFNTPLNNEQISTGQSISLFNEKKTSRFLSLKDDDDDEEE